MKHLLGTHDGLLSKQNDEEKPEEIKWRQEEVEGKLDLLVALDFRMTATPMYADIVLPAATWYEKKQIFHQPICIHLFTHLIQPLIHYGNHALIGTFIDPLQKPFPKWRKSIYLKPIRMWSQLHLVMIHLVKWLNRMD